MNALIFTLALGATLLTLLAALLTIPYWYGRSVFRHRMRKERDALVDDMLDGKLPKDHPAVRDALAQMDWALGMGRRLNMLEFLVFQIASTQLSSETRSDLIDSHLATRSCDGMAEDQAQLLETRREEFEMLFTGALLLGSWSGIFIVLARMPFVLFEDRRKKRATAASTTNAADTSISRTVDYVSHETKLGRRSKAFARAQHVAATAH